MKRVQLLIPFILICLTLFPLSGFSQNWDINILKNINVDRNQHWDPVFKTVSASTVPLSLAIPAGVVAYALVSKGVDDRKNAILITSSLASSAVVSLAMKYSFNRSRPYQKYPIIDNLTTEGTPSFPSAHSAFSFSLATSLSIIYPKWYVIAPAYLWAGSVAYSRMHLGVHYPTDVLAGALIGAGSSYLSYRLNEWMDRSYRTHADTPRLVVGYDQLVHCEKLH